MVGTVDLRMTVGTTTVQDARRESRRLRGTRGRYAGRCRRRRSTPDLPWMSRVDMTLLAQPGRARLQQLRVGGAMGFMAVHAVFDHRRMLVQERAAPLGVTAIAVLVSGRLEQLLRVRTAVRIVATGTGHLAFAEWHVRGALQLRSSHLMALQTEFGFLLLQLPILR